MTALHMAAYRNDVSVLETLISCQSVDFSAETYDGHVAHWMAKGPEAAAILNRRPVASAAEFDIFDSSTESDEEDEMVCSVFFVQETNFAITKYI